MLPQSVKVNTPRLSADGLGTAKAQVGGFISCSGQTLGEKQTLQLGEMLETKQRFLRISNIRQGSVLGN